MNPSAIPGADRVRFEHNGVIRLGYCLGHTGTGADWRAHVEYYADGFRHVVSVPFQDILSMEVQHVV